MAEKDYTKYKEIFHKNNTILRMSQAIKLGIPKYVIYKMVENGELVKEERGLYRLRETYVLSNPDLVTVSLRAPKCIICLTSALYHYELTTQIPHRVFIALPMNFPKPRIKNPPIDVTRISAKVFSVGIEEQIIDGVKVKFYNQEKTIVDCFKFRNKVGEDVALEALRDYMKRLQPNISLIMEYAKTARVEKLIRPYLEALV
jgi:predicted transcriptional regulator of viral defense system